MTKEKHLDSDLLARSLGEVLSYVKQHGTIEMQVDNEIFVIAIKSELLPDKAREFLTRGGPAG